MGQT
jgi:hypothetical protein